jgi:hypothetical protein
VCTLAAAVDRWLAGDPAALNEIADAIRALDMTQTAALAAAIRANRAAFSYRWAALRPEDVRKALDAAPNVAIEIAGLCSMHRNGRVREVALHVLAASSASDTVRFLVLRLDDIVDVLRATAQAALAARLAGMSERLFARDLVRALPLVKQLSRRQRAGASHVLRELTAYLLDPARGWTALSAGMRDPDPRVRAAAFSLALRGPRVDPVDLLARALSDPVPAIERWAATELTSSRADRGRQDALFERLATSRDPEIRRRALLARVRRGDPADALATTLVDPHSRVRTTAREKLSTRTTPLAIEILTSPHAPREHVVGALGALAECGTAEHAELAAARLDHADARIRAEAVRCVALLAAEAYADAIRRMATDRSARVRREVTRALARMTSSVRT